MSGEIAMTGSFEIDHSIDESLKTGVWKIFLPDGTVVFDEEIEEVDEEMDMCNPYD